MDQDNFNKSLGYRIKSIRKKRKLSQEDLAELIEMSVDTVSNIERGKNTPRLDTILLMTKHLGVEIHELFQLQDIPVHERQKFDIISEIIDLLSNQPDDILHHSLKQIKDTIKLKNGFVDKLNK